MLVTSTIGNVLNQAAQALKATNTLKIGISGIRPLTLSQPFGHDMRVKAHGVSHAKRWEDAARGFI